MTISPFQWYLFHRQTRQTPQDIHVDPCWPCNHVFCVSISVDTTICERPTRVFTITHQEEPPTKLKGKDFLLKSELWSTYWNCAISCFEHIPIGSMYCIFTYIYHQNLPNVGKYTIHGSCGILYFTQVCFFAECSRHTITLVIIPHVCHIFNHLYLCHLPPSNRLWWVFFRLRVRSNP